MGRMKKVSGLCLLLLLTGGVSCRKKPPLPPPAQPPPAVIFQPSEPPELNFPPVREELPPDEPAPQPAIVAPDPTMEADQLFAHGDLLAAESAYHELLEGPIEGPARGRILLHLGLIYADPSVVLYDPKKALEVLNLIVESDPVERSQAASLAHLLERLLELEADRQAIRSSLGRVEEELEKLKSIDERRERRP